jgi:glycerophosphoryl diester phosphodiesterase
MLKVFIGAHRGAMCHAPENTLGAFEKAIEYGTYRIECDIRRAIDGQLVMMHDATVDRTTDGTGNVGVMTLTELKQLRVGESETIPTLAESLACVSGRCRMLLELKDDNIATDVVRTVESANMLDMCTLISFSEDNLREARRANPDTLIGFFHLEPKPLYPARVVDEFGANLLVVWPAAAQPEVIAAAKVAGLHVRCGFRDDMTYEESRAVFTRMVDMGVDEVSCGRPDWIGRMIAERQDLFPRGRSQAWS